MSDESVPQPPAKKSTLHIIPSTRHREFIIESQIMPKREVHILAAASGVGKTTLTVQLIDELMEGNPIFDAPTHRIRPVYLCNDRSHDDVLRTFERVSPQHQYPVYSLVTDPDFAGCGSIHACIRLAKALHPETDFIVWDPISFNVENVNSSKEVSTLLRSLTKLCQELNVTIFVIHHTAKTKTDSGYANPRQRISGSAAWGGYSNLNLIIEEAEESDPTNPLRILYVCPRNGANRSYTYLQDENGCFVFAPTNEEDPAKQRAVDDRTFNALPFAEIASHQLYTACGKKTKGALERNTKRWLSLGCLEKISRGKFLKVKNVT